jgi:predicted aspartyl protease
VTTRRSLITNIGLLALLGGGAWLARERLMWPAPRPQFVDPVGPWLPFSQPDLPLVTVLAGVGGESVNALIDSGAQYTSVDRSLAGRLSSGHGPSIPMVALGVGGAAQMARGVSLDLQLGPLKLPSVRAAALDLQVVSRALGRSVPLIIGFDVLSSLIADIDFPGRRLRLLDPKTAVPPPGGVSAPVRRAGRALLAQVSLDGAPLEVLVDTGATGLVGISSQAAQDLGLTDRPARPARSVVLGGVAQSRVVSAGRFEFADRTFKDVDVHIIELPAVPGFPKGLMGVDALHGRRVVLGAGAGWMRLYGAA